MFLKTNKDMETYNKKNELKPDNKNRKDKRLGVGIIFIFIGAVLILSNIGIMPPILKYYIFSWQMLLIVIGIFNLVSQKNNTLGLILITAGVFFLLPEIFGFSKHYWRMFWPAIFIIIGAYILLKKRQEPNDDFFNENIVGADEGIIDDLNVFGGNKRTITSVNFLGGRLTSFFGGSEYDLLNTNMKNNKAVIDVLTIFGGSKFLVPAAWDVQIDVISIFGGFSDKRNTIIPNHNAETKTLIIKGLVVFGGGEIKNM